MRIIQIESTSGYHSVERQDHRHSCWQEGYIAVPPYLEAEVEASGGYCDLTIMDGKLVGITPTERPVEPEPVPDPVTETQLAVAELAQVVEDNNTANQLAIAELAGIILGG